MLATDRATEFRQSVLATDAITAAYAAGWTRNDAGVGPAQKKRVMMMHHEISAAVARERVSSYLAEAAADRLAKQARPDWRVAAAGRDAMAVWLVSFGRRLSQAQRPRGLIYGNRPRM